MEMAMGNNRDYMGVFREKIEGHAFVAIICDMITTNFLDSSSGFDEENNAWVEQVVLRMFHDYKVVLSWRNGEINMLVPHGEKELIQKLLESQLTGN